VVPSSCCMSSLSERVSKHELSSIGMLINVVNKQKRDVLAPRDKITSCMLNEYMHAMEYINTGELHVFGC
jgi:hypothetical protein